VDEVTKICYTVCMAIIKESTRKIFDTELNRYITYRGDRKHPYFMNMIYECNKKRYDKLKNNRLCKECMQPLPENQTTRCDVCNRKAADRCSARRFEYKLKAFDHYGGVKCQCCGIENPVFLTIDHVNNDGNAHRKTDWLARNNIYQWLHKHKYPEGFQVLCWNCNMGKQINGGVCPHNEQ